MRIGTMMRSFFHFSIVSAGTLFQRAPLSPFAGYKKRDRTNREPWSE
jgi:hypothetical protein